MQLVLGAADVQMLIAAAMGIGGLLSLRRARTPAGAPLLVALGCVLTLAIANYFLLGRHPRQFVKAWDVQHTWFGSKYAAELGYFRIYECTLFFDAQQAGRYRDVSRISDLREPLARRPARAALRRTDCASRFTPERRDEFLRDLAFFQGLAEQPEARTWFLDNGYNQSPFFTALTAPVFQRAPPSYSRLLAFSAIDVALELLPFALVWRAFGPVTTLLAAIYFFTSFSNQFALMGGSILRFAYLALLLTGVCLTQRARPRAAGVALGLASLFQGFPALLALGLALASGHRALRLRRLPAGALPFASAFLMTLVAGIAASLVVVGPESWSEFIRKLGLHAQMLSEYRVGLKLPLVLDWPIPPGGWLPYAHSLTELQARNMPYLASAALLLLAAAALAPKLRSLELAIVFACVALFVVTPVHYYFASLVLLFLVAPGPGARDLAVPLGRSLLFLLSAGAFAIQRVSGSLALVNNYWLSLGLLSVLVTWLAALHLERRPLEVELLEREGLPLRSGAQQHVHP